MQLKGKNAIVTGANRGIGKAVTEVFAQNGANIWACARKQSSEFEEWLENLSKENEVEITPVYFDLTSEEEITNGIKRIIGAKQQIDVLVNNAGVSNAGLFAMTPIKSIKDVFDINFFAQLSIMQLVLRKMTRQKSGSIINICSVSGINNEKGRLAYGSSKCALAFATKTISKEVGQYGVRVNAVSPGFIDTDMWSTRDKDLFDTILSETPVSRQGSPYEVANLVKFLASDESAYITGRNIVIDGGRL